MARMRVENRVLKGDNCKWFLKLAGNVVAEEGLDDIQLDSYLLNNLDLNQYQAFDFYSISAAEHTNRIITNEVIADLKNAQIKVKKTGIDDSEDSEPILMIPNSVGVTKAMTLLKFENGESLIRPFDRLRWEDEKISGLTNNTKTYKSPGGDNLQDYLSNYTPEQLIKMEEESWDDLTKIGTDVHKVYECIFNNKPIPSNLNLSQDIINSVSQAANELKSRLKKIHGEKCTFYTELGIKSKNLSQEVEAKLLAMGKDSINGVIDLLVIDDDGFAHVYDYKVSRKGIAPNGESISDWWVHRNFDDLQTLGLWVETKKQAATYQTELYKQMLSQYGIQIRSTNIVPIKLNLEYNTGDNTKDPFKVIGIKSISADAKQIITNPGRLQGGKLASKISRLFKIQATLTPEEARKMSEAYSILFPAHSLISKRNEIKNTVESYKRKCAQELKPGQTNYGTYKWKVYLPQVSGVIYCKDDQELTEALSNHIAHLSDIRADYFLGIADAIVQVKEGGDVSVLTNLAKNGNAAFMKSAFNRYLSDDWEFVRDDGANSEGILIFRKGNKCEITCLSDEILKTNMSDYGITKNPNWKGTTLLGKNTADKYVDQRRILPALAGNMEIVKALIYVEEHPEVFQRHQIAEIRALNPNTSEEMTAHNSVLIDNFNELIRANSGVGLKRMSANLFLDDKIACIEAAKERLFGLEQLIEKSSDHDRYTEEWFREKINSFKELYKKELDLTHGYVDTPAMNAYTYLLEGLNLCRGHKSYSETDKANIMSGKLYELNGLLMTSPQLSSSSNIRELAEIIDEYAKEVRRRVYEQGTAIQQRFAEVYKKYGTEAKAFDIWFADKERLELKDPNSPEFDGDPVTRKALDTFLKTLCKLRHPEIRNDEDLAKHKDDWDYYLIPLMEAKFTRQVKGVGIWKAIKNKFSEKKAITEGLFMGREDYLGGNMETYINEHSEIYNKFLMEDVDMRNKRITEYSSGVFETDLELVMNEALVAYNRTNVSREYIPLIAGLKLAIERDDYTSGKAKKEEILTAFNKTVKSKFYGESIVDPHLKTVLEFINILKSVFSTLRLSLNVRSFFRESIQGIITGATRAGVKMYPGITWDIYKDALEYVVQTAHKNFSGVSMLQQMNAIYGMANQSLSQIAGQRRLNWAHINHWGKDTAFITCSSPDFLHRMALLVAKMKSDGSFDAHSLDKNGKLVYDITKDKRFEHFIKGETSNENYLKEKALYMTIIDDFNQAGFRDKNGKEFDRNVINNLPQAYTRKEGQSIKNYADFLYGHYDDESKSLLYDTLFGAVFMQYKTYLTAKLEQWTIKEGMYNIATLEQQLDDNGNPLYVKYYMDEDDQPHKDILLQSEYEDLSDEDKAKCRLYYDYSGLPMQGMLQESLNVTKAIMSMNPDTIKEVWSDPTTKAQFLLQLHDMWLAAFMCFLVTFVFGKILGEDEPTNALKVRRAVRDAGAIPNFAYNVITGALDDSQLTNIVGSFANNPPSVVALQKFANSSWKLMTGNSSIAYWLTQNVGAIQDFQGIAKKAIED